jgi:hypothetical protein
MLINGSRYYEKQENNKENISQGYGGNRVALCCQLIGAGSGGGRCGE